MNDTYKFVRTDVLGKIPLLDAAGLIAGYQFALIGVDTYIVDCNKQGHQLPVSINKKVSLPGAELSYVL
jgi:hypothetical protein